MIKPFWRVSYTGTSKASFGPSYSASYKSERTCCHQQWSLTTHFTSGAEIQEGISPTICTSKKWEEERKKKKKEREREAHSLVPYRTLCYRLTSCTARTNMLPFCTNTPSALQTKLFLEMQWLWPSDSTAPSHAASAQQQGHGDKALLWAAWCSCMAEGPAAILLLAGLLLSLPKARPQPAGATRTAGSLVFFSSKGALP